MTAKNMERRTLYPPSEPYETGMLDVGDGQCHLLGAVRNAGAKPAVFLHGGPGSGCVPKQRSNSTLPNMTYCYSTSAAAAIDPVRQPGDNTTCISSAIIELLREMAGIDK